MFLICYGTRPEWIKIKPIIDEMEKQNILFKTLFTGQHKNIVEHNSDFILDMPDNGENRLDTIIKTCVSLPNKYFDNIKYILVQGDTSTALGLSLSAFHRKIKIVHLEAGLRTFDFNNPFPEEMNRQLISRMANINLCPTDANLENLKKENIKGNCYVVGNTVLDNLLSYKGLCEYQNKILITLHRRENHDIMDKWFIEINKLASLYKNLEFILPLHPNPNVQKYRYLLKDVNVINPLCHEELLKLLVKTKLVITDSGGLQEECSFLNKKTLVCRKTTERQESIGYSSFIISDPSNLKEHFEYHINNYIINFNSPYGDGQSAKRIVNLLIQNENFSRRN